MNIVCIGAHPDDAEFYAGGTILKWTRAGHRVLVVSMTNGDIGHAEQSGGALARRREEEVRRAAEIGGYDHLIFDNHDGELQPTLELRKEVVRLIRRRQADLVLTHRACDYHPDHRYASLLVQDAAFMVTVPHFCPDVPALQRNPVFAYMMDRFTRPAPFRPDAVVPVDDVMDVKWKMLDAMTSQVYEWLPWLEQRQHEVPASAEARLQWLEQQWQPFFEAPAAQLRTAQQQVQARFVELFEICEYGRIPDAPEVRTLFPV